ncbi:UNVERIFIED_CONTAM: hypothetical protein Sradi_4241600 [Sesamum radiatum]|uniref:DUF7906 domain-containing protein n=1 Tax=Sesamum radiatum TaxID=300843 RepID=A0AAW2P523_SESRA
MCEASRFLNNFPANSSNPIRYKAESSVVWIELHHLTQGHVPNPRIDVIKIPKPPAVTSPECPEPTCYFLSSSFSSSSPPAPPQSSASIPSSPNNSAKIHVPPMIPSSSSPPPSKPSLPSFARSSPHRLLPPLPQPSHPRHRPLSGTHLLFLRPFPSLLLPLLRRLLRSLPRHHPFLLLRPPPLPVPLPPPLCFPLPPSLSTSLSSALNSHLASAPSSLRSPLSSVPYSLIDEIIRQDFEKEKPISSFHIYIIHLGSQPKPYAYSYTPGDSSPGFTKCLGSIWTGNDRYLWIDLGAGPVDYGPALSGDGVLPKGEFHPLAALHGRPKSQKALLSDLASLVWSAYQVLLVPSLRIPVPFEDKLIVEFIHIHGDGGSFGLDWKSIERTFMDEVNDRGLLLGDQSLSFKKYEVKFSECSICSFTIARATTSYTSRYLFDNYTLIVSEYLDSKRLHQTILESVDEFRRVGKLPEEEFGRVLPVYVFDLEVNTILLLDRYHQSVAFKDMVIAVRTRVPRLHNSSLVDYTWSVGQTPFGPFSEISSLSFVQKDAARRNVLLTSLNYSITSGIDVLESIAAHGGDRKLLKQNRHYEFIQRWNLFRYKLDKSILLCRT